MLDEVSRQAQSNPRLRMTAGETETATCSEKV